TYRKYVGDGSLAQGWPAKSTWIPFADMWRQNIETLTRKICDNSEDENSQLLRAIKTVSNSTGVDKRFILAVVMEESRGCVRVHTTSLAVSNPGLMQSYQGLGSCAGTAASPLPLNPCPYTQIQQMIHDGTASNAAGVNLQDLLVRHTEGYQPIDAGTDETAKFYRAARMYNSG
ncbi:uncharacterized protein K489DRAFT_294915, partial [Dissoconium aciculare CBS 342.82]|uniref:Uncharacterized protein n=1 Tax=Dissoconium aciculare CBS 342.82 TaxID=1314786 RepID=A0A6J3M9G4_9PEZI